MTPEDFARLFAPGGLLDPATHYIILPDGIGHGAANASVDLVENERRRRAARGQRGR